MLFAEGVTEVIEGAKAYPLWSYLAWQDIRLRYRRSRPGPLWITLSMGIFVAALGIIFAKTFNMAVAEYLPFLATGYVFWFFISAVLGEAPNIFVESGAYLKELRINLSVLLMRAVARNVIIFAHNALIILLVFLYFDSWPGIVVLIAPLGFVLVAANLVAVSIILGILGARFRDIAPSIQNIVPVLFFISPISWLPKLVGEDSLILRFNPINYFMDLVRSPLLGAMPSASSWAVGSGLLVVNVIAAMALYVTKSRRVVFWV